VQPTANGSIWDIWSVRLPTLKSCGRGYEEQIAYYKAMMERAEKSLPIADIHSVESQDESIAIYHAAPHISGPL
jgi:hypothetical protein